MSNPAALDFGEREFGIVTEAGSVRFERLLPGPIERVWRYLTDSEMRGTWLAKGVMDLRVGSRSALHFRHADLSPVREETPEQYRHKECGGTITVEILRCDPPRLLAMTWEHESLPTSEVTFELTPRGDKVLLALTHRRLGDRGMMISVASGWHTHLAILADNLDGVTPRPFWSSHERAAAAYERRIPAA